jgi:secreted PhoX family phosphatase
VDFSTQGGVWVPCAGSVTPWQTHLGSEEWPVDAKFFNDQTVFDRKKGDSHGAVIEQLRYFDYYDGASNATVTKTKAMELGFYPYQYGYPWETVVSKDFTEKTTKLYVHGRQSYEMAYVMPDSKTVYHTDDGTNCVFTMLKLKKEKDLKEGTLFCMKMTQTSPPGQDAITFTADVNWIEMPTPTHAEVEAAIKTTTFPDLFDSESCNADFKCSTAGFISINVGTGCECLKVKAGKEKLASVFEKRRYAAYLGCTAELYRWEGITYDPDSKKAYTALSNVGLGMLGDDGKTPSQGLDPNDQGGPNHIKMKANSCGCVMEMDIDADMKVTKVRMLVCGKKSSAENPKKMGRFTDGCDINNIANPDNVAFIPGAKQVPPASPPL